MGVDLIRPGTLCWTTVDDLGFYFGLNSKGDMNKSKDQILALALQVQLTSHESPIFVPHLFSPPPTHI